MGVFDYVWGRWTALFLAPVYNHIDDNPIRLLTSLNRRQWGYFLVGLFAWAWDAFDFHSVTITYSELSKAFDRSVTQITLGVTLAMMFRPLGGACFGLAADRYGRRWPFICNNVLLIILELCTGFCQTYRQFLAVRSLFGFAMGGLYGNAAATALEDVPDLARGLLSGIFQSGYNLGYILAVAAWKILDGKTRHGWRVLFWFGAVPPVLLILARATMKETQVFRSKRPLRESSPDVRDVLEGAYLACRRHWRRISYLVIFMMGFSYMSHGTQDVYALMLQNRYEYNSSHVTRVLVTANVGGFIGGTVIGYMSQIFGRRLAIICMCILAGLLLYPYTFTSGPGLYAAVFFEQFCVFGAFGVIPIHLIELSPTAFRTFIVGTSYNLGILIASASNTIETAIGQRYYPLPSRDGTVIYDYGPVICIFCACVLVFVALVTSVGPEKRGATLWRDDDDNDNATAAAAEKINPPEQLNLSPLK